MVISGEMVLLLSLLSLAGMLVAMLLLSAWWRGRELVRAERLERKLERMLQNWAQREPSSGEVDWLIGLAAADRRALLRCCLRLLSSLDTTAAVRLRDAVSHAGLLKREVLRLRHRSPQARADACAMLGKLGQRDAIPMLVERLGDQDLHVRRQAIGALADLQAVDALGDVVEAIEAASDWGNLLAVMALVRMGPSSVPRIGALLESSRTPAMTKALLQVTGRLGAAANPAAVRVLAAHPNSEIRVEAVRTLGSIAPDPDSVTTCLAAMDDPEWPVRALAAWSLGRLGDGRAVARLRQAMGDSSYWVRHHTAGAIAGLGEAGQAALQSCLDDANPFVRDMAAQALFMSAATERAA